jgi:quercetin dioxygenase-like cupin family protein
VTGTDANGRSCVVEDLDVGPSIAMPGLERHVIYESQETPPPPRPIGHGEHFPMEIDPGRVLWYFTTMDPDAGFEVPIHHTDTVDVGVLLDGSIELVLDDGVHLLEAGDCFVINGDDHSWRVSPGGCRICATSVGTSPPGDGVGEHGV